ncbi:MAG: ABC transporter permease [Candidatus Izimaplasma sp.]|nr:ABC transporter permease [Candidatus Izimaplasma bacterium]
MKGGFNVLRYSMIRLFLITVTLFIIVSMIQFFGNVVMYAKWSSPHPVIEDVILAWTQYKVFLKDVFLDWDFGNSYLYNQPAWQLVLSKLWVTVMMNLAAYIFYVSFGLILGVFSAIYKDSLFDKIVVNTILAIGSVPIYIMILGLILFFGYTLFILDPLYTQVGDGLIEQLKGLIIPVLALSFWPLANIIRLTRAEVIDELNDEFILILRAKGLKRHQIIFRHTLKHVLTTLIPEVTNIFVMVLSFSFLIEIVYQVPGVAKLLYDSIVTSGGFGSTVFLDLSNVIVVGMFYAFLGLIIGYINDLILPLIDPRIKMGIKR